jgi:hypothetical protein
MDLRTQLQLIFEKAINDIGLTEFKKISWFGSNDPAFKRKAT